ncbi:zincin [Melanomma pulvis-pyrius CBS 109.77]|uniref:Zincin n=1 Tax=Melanomma pulvis-pyrius CBS 109.77 TaxID=1314802 RepID=A0A6A6XXY8_9PLEO|nr:zincin [Melanomma pulvis-pyrius CBS 109.77]
MESPPSNLRILPESESKLEPQATKEDSLKEEAPNVKLSAPHCFFIPPLVFEALVQDDTNDDTAKRAGSQMLAVANEVNNTEIDEFVIEFPPIDKEKEKAPYRRIYDMQFCKNDEAYPGVLMRSEGEDALNIPGDDAVDKCYENIGTVYTFFKEVFNNAEILGPNVPLIGIVHYDFYFPNARWYRPVEQKYGALIFGDGWDNDAFNQGAAVHSYGGCFGNFVGSLEVVAHELTHGLVQRVKGLKYFGESGALHEHMGDVFGSMCEQWKKGQSTEKADWIIGEDLVAKDWPGVSLRSMKSPGDAYDKQVGIGNDDQVCHWEKRYLGDMDNGGVHLNSGIPNKAFYLIAKAFGGNSWEKAGQIWYKALHDPKVGPECDLATWARVTTSYSRKLFKEEGRVIAATAWKEVGIEV